ncbi:hypothetical protein [Anditalea andensis]|uniref:hypothetical protein n=1 Tax=Anditalea andensis TaxID=1048983 RepID=UPI0013DF6061|nr:hypothetical protein [Anditalea andensis]
MASPFAFPSYRTNIPVPNIFILFSYASRQGMAVNDGYKECSIKKDKLEVIALTQ